MLTVLFLAAGCSPSAPEAPDIRTSLSVSTSFTGSRVMTVRFPSSVIAPGSDRADSLSMIVRKYCPSVLDYADNSSSEEVSFTFTLSFASYSDYTRKLHELLGTDPGVVYCAPSTPLTSGWRLEESFTSSQLFGWMVTGANVEQLSDFSYDFSHSENKLTYSDSTIDTAPAIRVNRISGSPIDSVRIDTVNKSGSYDRTIVFTIPQTTFDKLGTKLSDYFKDNTDPSGKADWLLEDKTYQYKVVFTDLTIKQLEGYTNKLLSSVYGDAAYVDKDKNNTPLSYQNSFVETIDLSAYTSDNNEDVPLEYNYTLTDKADLSDPELYTDLAWKMIPSESSTKNTVSLKTTGPSVAVRISDGKQYVPSAITLTLTPLDNDHLQKSVSFAFPIEQDGYEASDYTTSYFEGIGFPCSRSVDKGSSVCTITFSGAPGEINSKFTDVFGDGNLTSYDSEVPFLTLRTRKTITDRVDMSSLLIGKNIDTPVLYRLLPRDGELPEYLSLTNDDITVPEYAPQKDEPGFSMGLQGKQAEMTACVSVTNWSEVFWFLGIGLVMILITSAMIIFFRSRSIALSKKRKKNPPDQKTDEKD